MDIVDRLISDFDTALRTVAGVHRAGRPSPGASVPEADLGEHDRAHAAALMRVNHVGEVCAQALYQGQAMAAGDPAVRQSLQQSAREEEDHLAWTAARVEELGGRLSYLNPIWYAGALALGAALGTVAVIVRQEIVLFIMGGVFVVETLSVMLQVAWFKYTRRRYGEGRRILLMAPLHHHFEQRGWKETQVVVRFWIIPMMLVLFGLSTLKLR